MNYVLFENENRKETFMWEKELENLPNGTIAFSHYQQDNIDENGMIQSCEYRIGVPVKFIIGDLIHQIIKKIIYIVFILKMEQENLNQLIQIPV